LIWGRNPVVSKSPCFWERAQLRRKALDSGKNFKSLYLKVPHVGTFFIKGRICALFALLIGREVGGLNVEKGILKQRAD
jgi:hypothetical protein